MNDAVVIAMVCTIPPTILAIAALIQAIRIREQQRELRRDVNGRLDQLIAETRRRAIAETTLRHQVTPPPGSVLPPEQTQGGRATNPPTP